MARPCACSFQESFMHIEFTEGTHRKRLRSSQYKLDSRISKREAFSLEMGAPLMHGGSQSPPAKAGGLLLALPATPGGVERQPATIGALTGRPSTPDVPRMTWYLAAIFLAALRSA